MEDNKKALTMESCTYNNIIASTDCTCNMPEIMQDLLSTYQQRYINTSPKFLLNVLISKTAQMLTGKRITFNEAGKINIPNWYAIIFAPSGYGKDRLVNDLDSNVFKNYRLWFKDKAKQHYDAAVEKIKRIADSKYPNNEKQKNSFINNETARIRHIVMEISNGTQEGLYTDCKAFSNADFGSAYIKISELGGFLETLSTDKQQFFNCLFEAYDGKINSKCIKNESREESIENMPVNALLYSDYTLFQKQLKTTLYNLLKTGLNRRSVITFQTLDKLKAECFTLEQEKHFRNETQRLGDRLFSIFTKINLNNCYVLNPEAKDKELNNYKIHLTQQANATEQSEIRTELLSRELKALKLSCLFACLNHPEELVINQLDMQQAISTVEYLSSDFKEFINYKPKSNDFYDNVFNFFLSHQHEEITKTSLTRTYFKEFNVSRTSFINNFDETIEIVKGIAQEKGYILIEQSFYNNSGTKYYLQKLNTISDDETVQSLTELLQKKSSGQTGQCRKSLYL